MKTITIKNLGVTTEDAFKAGYESVSAGTSTKNCHFKYFTSKALTKAWENGARKAKQDNND